MLTIWSCEATRSSGYDGIILSDLEYGVRTYRDHLREVLPVVDLEDEPEPIGTHHIPPGPSILRRPCGSTG